MNVINLQTRILLRLMMPIIIITGGLCLFAVWIGTQTPTHIVYAHTTPASLLWIDPKRNLTIQHRYPVNPDDFSVIALGQNVTFMSSHIVFWDTSSGRIIEAQPNYLESSFCRLLTWSIDFSNFIYVCEETQLWILDTANQSEYLWMTLPAPLSIYSLTPNPSDKLAFRDADGQIYILDISQREISPLKIADIGFIRRMLWFADEQSLLIVGDNSMIRYTPSTQAQTTIVSDFNIGITGAEMKISPNGEWLSFIADDNRAYSINLTTGAMTRLQTEDFKVEDVVWLNWSPTSEWIMLSIPIRSEDDELYVIRPDASELIVFGAGVMSQVPMWSPDGSKIAYVAQRGNIPQLFIWEIGGEEQFIISQARNPRWSSDSTAIVFEYFSGMVTRASQLGYYNLQTGIYFFTRPSVRVEAVGFVR